MNNKYADSMKKFFGNLDRRLMDNPIELALAFASSFWNGQHSHDFQQISLPKDNINNISILSCETELSFLTKRVSLVADTTVITHHKEESHKFWSFYEETDSEWNTLYPQHTDCYIRCPDLSELGKWLKNCKGLLLSGDIYYYPDILIRRQEDNRFYGETGEPKFEEASIAPLCDLVVQNKKIVATTRNSTIKSQFIRSILELDLPYIENTDLETFSKITSDEREPVQRFRDFLRLKFLDLNENEGSTSFDKNLTKIGLEIKDGVRALNSDYKITQKKAAFQITGAVIAATTATLVAVNSAAFSVLPELLGTSGGILAIANALQQYHVEKQKIEDMPYYYLWLFRH